MVSLQQFLSPVIYVLLAAGEIFALEEIHKALFPKLYSFGKYKPKLKGKTMSR